MPKVSPIKPKHRKKYLTPKPSPIRNAGSRASSRNRSRTHGQSHRVTKNPKSALSTHPDQNSDTSQQNTHPDAAITRSENNRLPSIEVFDMEKFAANHPTVHFGAALLAHIGEIRGGWNPNQPLTPRTMSHKDFQQYLSAHMKAKCFYEQLNMMSMTEEKESGNLDGPIRRHFDNWVTAVLHSFLGECQDSGYCSTIKSWNCLIAMDATQANDGAQGISTLLSKCQDCCLNTQSSVAEIRELRGYHWKVRKYLDGRVNNETLTAIDGLVVAIILTVADRRGIVNITPLLDNLAFY